MKAKCNQSQMKERGRNLTGRLNSLTLTQMSGDWTTIHYCTRCIWLLFCCDNTIFLQRIQRENMKGRQQRSSKCCWIEALSKEKFCGKQETEDLPRWCKGGEGKNWVKEVRWQETRVTCILTFLLLFPWTFLRSALLVCALCAQSFLSDGDDWWSLWNYSFVQATWRDFPHPSPLLSREKLNLSGALLPVEDVAWEIVHPWSRSTV